MTAPCISPWYSNARHRRALGSFPTRTLLKRFRRLSLYFSKKLENLCAAVATYVAYYTFCWMHASLNGTPAMAANVAGHPWSIEEPFDRVMG